MDAVSGTASIITILSTVVALSGAIYSLVDSIKDAPADLASLSIELQDLRAVLASVELSVKCANGLEENAQLFAILPTILRRMEDKMRKLDTHIRGFGEISHGCMRSFKGLEWAIKGKDKAHRLREDIGLLKWPITACLGSLSISSTGHMKQTLSEVRVDVQVLQTDFKNARMALEQQQRVTNLSIENAQKSQETSSRLLESKIDEICIQSAEHGLNMFISGQLHSLLPPSAAAVHLSVQQRSMCVSSCACLCHKWRELRTPRVLDGLIGSFLIGYTGVPLVTRTCTTKRCKVRATYAVRLNYQSPAWLQSHVVTLSTYSRYGRPTAGLSVAQVRQHSSQIFSLAESGNVGGLKYAFDHGFASPFDISAQTGDYPLHIAADHGFVDACRLLLSYGADPYQQDVGKKNTPHSFAWAVILGKSVPSKQQKQLAALFPNVQSSLEFPRLHQIVLELRPGNLDAEHSRYNFNIDIQDGEGNTALQWACLRGDVRAATWLLQRGANPNTPNFSIGRTPLMAACSCVSVACIELLLDHGADVHARSRWGLDAMLYLCEEDRNPQPISDMVEIAKLFIAQGVDLNPYGETKVWCLARAARTEIVELMELIIDQGVDINQPNQYGLTALVRSISWCKSRSVEFLLSRGAAYAGEVLHDKDNRTILHHAAINPDLQILGILISSNLQGIDPDSQDKSGITAEQYFDRTSDHVPGIVPAFRQLISDVRQRYSYYSHIEESQSGCFGMNMVQADDDIFYDAFETV